MRLLVPVLLAALGLAALPIACDDGGPEEDPPGDDRATSSYEPSQSGYQPASSGYQSPSSQNQQPSNPDEPSGGGGSLAGQFPEGGTITELDGGGYGIEVDGSVTPLTDAEIAEIADAVSQSDDSGGGITVNDDSGNGGGGGGILAVS